jgi:OPA family glycerol-3-phosphate transporter-like MFS transporter
VNGYIGDRVPANRFILIALFGTLACNLGMAAVNSFGLMLLIWGLNGYFQSMFWSTIIRVLAQNISADKRATVSAGISLAMPAAYIVSWGLLGQLLDGAQVKW